MTLLSATATLWSQTVTITGIVRDAAAGQPAAGIGVAVKGTDLSAETDVSGTFTITGSISEEFILVFNRLDFRQEIPFTLANETTDLGVISVNLSRNPIADDQIFTILIADEEDDTGARENISGLLTASNDIFQSTAAFVFGPMRFRQRGYDSENNRIMLNGLPFNDMESGAVFWSAWGGLNDVTRNQETHPGLESAPFAFGGAGGALALDLRASAQHVQKRFSFSNTNRAYRNRIMGTYVTGLGPKGWAFALSGSRRWANEGYIDGTFFDAWSYFLSVDKKLSASHMLNVVVMGAPAKRGRDGAAISEMFDLAGHNYYNPNWGYQNGEKRNARVADVHQPIMSMRHDWNITRRSILTTAVGFQFGKNANSALDWFNTNDPRPDYYRRLPSFVSDPDLAARMRNALTSDPALLQVQWDELYRVNYASSATILNGDGIPGNHLTGNLSRYIIEDRRFDNTRVSGATTLQHVMNDRVTLSGGLQYNWQRSANFRVVKDLLGGSFYVDHDRFAAQDFPGDEDALQNDLNRPNRILREGDTFGHDFDAHIRNAEAWSQISISLPHFDLYGAATGGSTTFWRTGHMRNGRFPDNSFGDSEKKDFLHGGAKAGVTWKIDGRNYFSARGMYMTRAPYFRNAMISPRTRNDFADGLTTEKILGGEAGYTFRAPYFKAQLTGYYTEFRDQVLTRNFYHDDERTFVNFTMTGIDQEHIGIEAAAEATIRTGLKVHGVAAIGQYIFTSRPQAVVTQDNNASVLNRTTVYQKNFYVAGTPQSAYTIGVNLQTKHFMSFYLNLNYFDNLWIDINPVRRTVEAVELVEQGSPQWLSIIAQERAPGGFTMDASVFKSFRIKWFGDPVFLALSFNVTNLLDNQDLINGGFEQLRFDFINKDVNRFPSRYFYFPGFNYFFNASIRF